MNCFPKMYQNLLRMLKTPKHQILQKMKHWVNLFEGNIAIPDYNIP